MSTGGNGGSGGMGGFVPNPACVDLASAHCARVDECAPFQIAIFYGDEATCVAREAIVCTLDVTAPGSSRTEAMVQACAGEIAAATCDDWASNALPSCTPDPGAIADGGACFTPWQCQGRRCAGLFDLFERGCGTCESAVPLGGTCTDIASCDDGLLCIVDTCEAPGKTGEDCSPSGVCVWTLACATSTGKCQTGGAPGASCTDLDCDFAHGAWCANQTCVAVERAGAGEACVPPAGFCAADLACINDTCVAEPDVGEKCNAVCVYPARCVQEACALVDATSCM